MSLSDHATQGSCSGSFFQKRASETSHDLQAYRLAASGYGTTKSSNGWHGEAYYHDRGRAAVAEFEEAFKGASRGSANHSSSGPRTRSHISSDFQSACDKDIGGSGTLPLSFAENTNVPDLPRHAEASEEAFHEMFYAVVRLYQDWLASWASKASPNQEDKNYRSTTGTSRSSRNQSQQQQQGREKRKRQDDERHSEEGNHGGGSDDYGRHPVKKSRDTKLRLACPFFKRDAEKYADHQYCLHHWPTTSRVKEHLYQQHMLSGIQCGLCGAEFSSQPSFQAHQREPGACERQAFEPLEGIDALTKMKLQDKKVARGAPEDAKWRAMYSILFPDDDPSTYPDPYYDLFPVLRQQLATFLHDEIPLIIRNAINDVTNNIETRTTPDVNELQIAITASIESSLQRFRPEQESLSPNIRSTEAEIGDPYACLVPSVEGEPVIPHSLDHVFTEGLVEAAGGDTAEALLRQFQAELGDEQTFANTHETELGQLLDYYCDQEGDSGAIQIVSDEENEDIEWVICNRSLTENL
ncbi:hypothetical protein F4824DRAFT_478722 [Ustulina deusta]|nr:hypothetical protein F4824DRAFT_478722 [Ustulina deusta]